MDVFQQLMSKQVLSVNLKGAESENYKALSTLKKVRKTTKRSEKLNENEDTGFRGANKVFNADLLPSAESLVKMYPTSRFD